MPQRTREREVADPDGMPLISDERPQDPHMTGAGLKFSVLSWGAEYDDDMPEEIRMTDREGRSCVYEPIHVNGRAVNSKGFQLLGKKSRN